jgi:hypothetical protein
MNQVLRDNNLEGTTVYVRRDKEIKEVKVVRGNDLLVQEKDTKRYYNVSRHEIEYTEIPQETGTDVSFSLADEGKV